MSDEPQHSNESEAGMSGTDAESDVMRFLRELPKKKRLLGSPVPGPQLSNVYRLRSEWAKSLLTEDRFTDAMQLMNEKLLQELCESDPKDPAALAVLSVKASVIQEFGEELKEMIDTWEAVLTDRHQRIARDREAGEIDPYAEPDQPLEDIVI